MTIMATKANSNLHKPFQTQKTELFGEKHPEVAFKWVVAIAEDRLSLKVCAIVL